jgi:hypothetical protein
VILKINTIFKYLKRDKVLLAAVPQIEGLTVEDMLDFARANAAVLRYLPDERDWDNMDRKWTSDVLFTVEKAKFEKMIKDAIKLRRERMEDKNNLNVSMRPEFLKAFESCISFSSNTYHSLKGTYSGQGPRYAAAEIRLQAKAYSGRA